jgi:peroxiredoxin
MRRYSLLLAIITLFLISPFVRSAELGINAPDCLLTSLSDNQKYQLNQFRGQVLIVDFWASWCGPCAKSFPFFNRLHRDMSKQGVAVVGVNLDENKEDAHQFLETRKVEFLLAVDANENCAKQFEIKAMPSTFIIDRKGVLRHTQVGFHEGESEQFLAMVEKLLAEP